MRKTFSLLAVLLLLIGKFAQAQPYNEGTTYYLPRTAVNITLLLEKTTKTPGEYYMYSERFLKKNDVCSTPQTAWRIIDTKMYTIGIPDTSKMFTPLIDGKHTIYKVKLSPEGVILAVNEEAAPQTLPVPFVPAQKPTPLNPRDYMSQDILSAGSIAKMAELTAQEIYDIRESKGQLNKGQADFMPKDGEQLRIMLKNLDKQEEALLQMFEGTTVKDTSEITVTFIPNQEVNKQVLFRFSKQLGMLDRDDLGGTPYYISVEDLHHTATNEATLSDMKKRKDDVGIYANLPGKMKVSLYQGAALLASKDFNAAQFGKTEPLDPELFGKKLMTNLIYNPVTGNIESIKTELTKK